MNAEAPYGILSICTGVGALDIAVRRSLHKKGIDTEFVAFVENDPNCSKVLRHHYPNVPNLGDLKSVGNWDDYQHVRVITAGFPCQPFSVAGNRLGENDDRYLWPFIETAIRTIRPDYIFLENVAGFRSQGFGGVAASLAANGYVFRWHSVRAADIGAPHKRDRVFIVARPAADTGSV
ncbi:DNA methylase [Gordonia phage Jumbo]|uniref:DNA methylase n=1 Tax=Gordonia phage Jumbo TaxID=1887650 RepID=A0A1B3B0P1_9CAUD|nr:DNA methyltransferase [Gordonia phage Jumbo]AOE44546.1 DNA methylase [Gordonia phage Jumbo]